MTPKATAGSFSKVKYPFELTGEGPFTFSWTALSLYKCIKDMKETIICQPWDPIETWRLIKKLAKIMWEWIKSEIH